MSSYRGNISDFALGYDAAADIIHPHYLAIQNEILRILKSQPPPPAPLRHAPLIVDLGSGSGRLMERILDQHPLAHGIVLGQSEPFLALAERRLARFGPRATYVLTRLQDDWPLELPQLPTAFVSMSAIHHLEPAEKQSLYQRCYDALAPGGLLLNGDEVRPLDDNDYLATLNAWADHMRHHMTDGSIPPLFHSALHGWIDRNVTRFGQPKKSGDDCHETIDSQLAYFRTAGFAAADAPWHRDLWAVLRGIKS